MRSVVIGDVHGRLDTVDTIIARESPDFVLCTGDLESYRDMLVPLYFIRGNHEDFETIGKMDAGLLAFRNLFHIKSGEVLQATQLLRIAGLGGNYSPSYYHLKSSELPGARKRHFTQDDVERCKGLRSIDIFLCHEAPAGIGVEKRGQDIGIDKVAEVLATVKPRYFFFGHHHRFAEIQYQGTKIISLDRVERGYVVISDGPAGITHKIQTLGSSP